jgi:Inner membrane protein YgaP-like, transmembrane domain
MNTIKEPLYYQHVTKNERTVRAIIGFVILLTVILGVIASPVFIFATSMIAVYLVLTAIIGTVPGYITQPR